MKRLSCLLTLALGACGIPADLEPVPGASLPPPRYGTAEPAPARDLLDLDPQAAPARTVEQTRETEERADDPFDLPPES